MTRRRLVDEREVRRLAAQGAREIDATEAVVTPSARDVAARLGVTIRAASARRAPDPAPVAASSTPAATPSPALRIVVGADHGGVAMKDAIAARLRELGHSVIDVGTTGTAAVDYPDYAVKVAQSVAASQSQIGIMVDGAGIGSAMAANKVRGIRAALCHDVTTAQNAREHNHANVLTLGGTLIGIRLALAIVDTFVATPFGGGRHAARVAKIDQLDQR